MELITQMNERTEERRRRLGVLKQRTSISMIATKESTSFESLFLSFRVSTRRKEDLIFLEAFELIIRTSERAGKRANGGMNTLQETEKKKKKKKKKLMIFLS